jgi:Pyridoxamine 5'-phosphate oxidase
LDHKGERSDGKRDLGALARGIVDSNLYMTLATADEAGLPWASPVWYAVADYREFFWVSSPEARHSRNIAVRPRVAIVIFDSRAPEGTAQAVYVSAVAEELGGADVARGIGIFSRASAAAGGELSEWHLEDVRAPAPYRLYRARASEHWVLDPDSSPDRRAPVVLE